MCLTSATFTYTCTHISSLDIRTPHSPNHPNLLCTFTLNTSIKPRALDIPCPSCRRPKTESLAADFASAGQVVPFLRAREGIEDAIADNIVAESWKSYTALYHILQTGEMATTTVRTDERREEYSPLGPGEYEGMFELRPSDSWPADVEVSPTRQRRWTMLPDEGVSQSMIDEVESMLEAATEGNRVQAFAQVPQAMLRRWSLVSATLERIERPGWRDWSAEEEEQVALIVAEATVGRDSIVQSALLSPLSGRVFGKQEVSAACADGGILTAAVHQVPSAEPVRRRPHAIDVASAASTPRRASFVPDTPLESLRIRRGDTFDTLPPTPRRASFVPDTPLTAEHRHREACETLEALLPGNQDETPATAPQCIPEIAVEVCSDKTPVDFTPYIRRSLFDMKPDAPRPLSFALTCDTASVVSIRRVIVTGDSRNRNTIGGCVTPLALANGPPASSQASFVVSSRRSSRRAESPADAPDNRPNSAHSRETLRPLPLTKPASEDTVRPESPLVYSRTASTAFTADSWATRFRPSQGKEALKSVWSAKVMGLLGRAGTLARSRRGRRKHEGGGI